MQPTAHLRVHLREEICDADDVVRSPATTPGLEHDRPTPNRRRRGSRHALGEAGLGAANPVRRRQGMGGLAPWRPCGASLVTARALRRGRARTRPGRGRGRRLKRRGHEPLDAGSVARSRARGAHGASPRWALHRSQQRRMRLAAGGPTARPWSGRATSSKSPGKGADWPERRVKRGRSAPARARSGLQRSRGGGDCKA